MSVLVEDVGADLGCADLMITQRCEVYRRRFGLEVFFDPAGGYIAAVTGCGTAAVVAPRVLAAAACRSLGSVPVFAVGGDRWVLLTEGVADLSEARQLSWSVFQLPIVAVFAPIPVALPTPCVGLRSWLRTPDGPVRPPIDSVVAALETAFRSRASQPARQATEPRSANMFVPADGTLAEYVCRAEPLGMIAYRARQLCELHDGHSEECRVLAAAQLHLR
ncbi:hypothetical protein HLB23_38430 [Nocardia uniformis]|uniref:Uncharacterized protein n=1 Tax=Nocardia uniformis TaxID=53432 RepID=A0A849CAL4_9NOCA|nr:hypothetical protein [Nocardia uniformis]NNH75664.1 hypothetical protein [Nocardia uniformis]